MSTPVLSAPGSPQTLGYLALLRGNRNFRRLWLGQIVSQLGDWLDYVALLTLLLQLTGSGTAVATMLVARFLPTFFIGPLAGVVVDRLDRRRIMVIADLLRAVLVLGLLFVGTPERIWLCYIIVALVVSVTAFFEPARTASIPNLTTREELITANALGAVTWSTALAVGSALGGFVTAAAGWRTAIVLDALSFACSAWLIGGIRLPSRPARPRPIGVTGLLGLREFAEGVRYLRRHPPVATVVFVKCGWSVAGGMVLLHSIFGERIFPIFGSAAAGIGLVAMMRGVGTALGPVVSRRFFGTTPAEMARGITGGFVVAGMLYLVFAATTHVAPALALLALAHMGGSTVWVFSTTLLQVLVPDEFRGRVFAAELAFMTLGMTVSSFLTGWALDSLAIGPRPLMAILAALCFPPAVAWRLLQGRDRFRVR